MWDMLEQGDRSIIFRTRKNDRGVLYPGLLSAGDGLHESFSISFVGFISACTILIPTETSKSSKFMLLSQLATTLSLKISMLCFNRVSLSSDPTCTVAMIRCTWIRGTTENMDTANTLRRANDRDDRMTAVTECWVFRYGRHHSTFRQNSMAQVHTPWYPIAFGKHLSHCL